MLHLLSIMNKAEKHIGRKLKLSLCNTFILTTCAIIGVIGTILLFTSCSLLMPRPQEPKERSYNVRKVVFKGGSEGVTLAGEVTMPQTNGPFPAVILIAGSGPHNRNEEVAGHKVFLVLSDYLTRRGYAVLRYDKRGIGKSSGSYQTATMEDFAKDAGAAMRWLKTQSNVDTARVGFLGHSTGGYVAPLAAQRAGAAFLILLAAPARELAEEIYYQNTVIPRVMGKSEKWTALNMEAVREMIKIYKSAETAGQLREQSEGLVEKYRSALSLPSNYVEKSLELLPAVWWMWAARYDPLPALKTYPGPVLAMFGGKDLQVSAKANASVLEEVLSHEASKIISFPELNHLFQPAKTGTLEEYAWIETTFDQGAIEAIVNWLDSLSF
jgi:alpha/beta superfamily hydrolase